MTDRRREFVAEDLWLLIAIVTFALSGVVTVSGFGVLGPSIAILGWFLLVPTFYLWGEDIAAWLFEADEPAHAADVAAVNQLKRRYAEGEIGDEEFERRLERLVRVDALPDDVFVADPEPTTVSDVPTEEHPLETERDG